MRAARAGTRLARWTSNLSARAEDACARMWDFMREHVFPAEPVYDRLAGRATTSTGTRR